MSILRYNNGGTWEAINIDHASTADSALYDNDGNIISSTYLPLSAGSGSPLTGVLYGSNVEGLNPTTLTMYAKDNGVYLEGSYDGVLDGGISTVANDGRVIVYGNGTSVVLRPNGRGDANGQVYIDSSGQQHGGHPYTLDENTTSRSTTAGNYGIAYKLFQPGLWGIQFQARFVPGAAGMYGVVISKSSSSATGDISQQNGYFPTYGGSAFVISCYGFVELSSATTIGFHFYGNQSATVSYTKIAYTQIQ